MNVAMADKRNLSAAIGEVSSEAWVKKTYPGATRQTFEVPGNGQKDQFDDVYTYQDDQGNEKWMVIEAKGGQNPESQLGTRKYGEQGTQNVEQGTSEYFDSILTAMSQAAKGSQGSDEYRQALGETAKTLREVWKANDGRLSYQLVTRKVSASSGELQALKAGSFNLPPLQQ